MVNIVLVSKNLLFRQCLKLYLEGVSLSDSINHYSFIEELIKHEETPEIVIVELNPEFRNFQSINNLLESFSGAKVLVIANNLQLDEYRQLIDSGVKGTISGQDDIEELVKAVKEIASGKIFYPYNILQQIMVNKPVVPGKQATGLTDREVEILLLLCDGLSNEQISERIHLSYDTVKWHRSNILNKCECKNILSLYKYAIKNDLVPILRTR